MLGGGGGHQEKVSSLPDTLFPFRIVYCDTIDLILCDPTYSLSRLNTRCRSTRRPMTPSSRNCTFRSSASPTSTSCCLGPAVFFSHTRSCMTLSIPWGGGSKTFFMGLSNFESQIKYFVLFQNSPLPPPPTGMMGCGWIWAFFVS